MSKEQNKGFAAILPVLIIAAIVVIAFSVKEVKNSQNVGGQAVLSESSSGSDQGGDSGQSGSGSSGGNSGSQNTGASQPSQSGPGTSGEGSGKSSGSVINFLSPNNAPSTPRPAVKIQDGLPEPSDLPEVSDFPEVTDNPQVETQVETHTDVGTHSATIKIQNGDTHFELQHPAGNIQVQGEFPLSVDPQTKELTASTSAGTKTVATLPDQAIQNLISSGILTNTSGVQLTADQNGELHYQIQGTKNGKLLGIFNVALNKTALVNVQTGQVTSVDQTTLTKLLDSLTF